MLSLEGESEGWSEGEVVNSSGVGECAMNMKVGLVADELGFGHGCIGNVLHA